MTTAPVRRGVAASIRAELEQSIASGAWPVGTRIPTEHALMQLHGCARMTVRTALSDLTARGLIVRRRRAGSFVAMPIAGQAALAIADLATEARRDGRVYRHEIMRLGRCTGGGAFAATEPLVSVACRHLFDETPIAWEERLIRIASAPRVTRARFRALAPGPWLLRHVKWSKATHEISAACAEASMAQRLAIARGTALLCLHRRTWCEGQMVTDVRFVFPGHLYRFTGGFTPS